jgi:hypothetical protein
MSHRLIEFHPEYVAMSTEMELYRDILYGGHDFVTKYVKPFRHEDTTAYNARLAITPSTEFARAAIMRVRNAIFQRMDAIRRNGGSRAYQEAIAGKNGGVDLRGSTMNYFMGMKVLTELVFMGRVGIYVDSPASAIPEEFRTLQDSKGQHAYVYPYASEDILNWDYYLRDNRVALKALLLRVRKPNRNTSQSYFARDEVVEYREYVHHAETDEVTLTVWDEDMASSVGPFPMEINEIPFVMPQLDAALTKSIAYHQIALTNLESADVNYAHRGNTIIWVEKYDPYSDPRDIVQAEFLDQPTGTTEDGTSEADTDRKRSDDRAKVTKIGSTDGLRIPTEVEFPQFVHPSSEPLKVSMEKQAMLKDDIERLVDLAVNNSKPRLASAESKRMDQEGLLAGLAAIGLVLEQAEREVGRIWSLYDEGDFIDVHYPQRYSLKSDEDRRKDTESIIKLGGTVADKTWRVESYKEAAIELFGGKVSDDTLDKMLVGIERTPWPTADYQVLKSDSEQGFVSSEGASEARGYPEGEAKKAQEERKERDAARLASQTPPDENLAARGVGDDPNNEAKLEKDESQSPENNPDGKRKTRGNDKGNRQERRQ